MKKEKREKGEKRRLTAEFIAWLQVLNLFLFRRERKREKEMEKRGTNGGKTGAWPVAAAREKEKKKKKGRKMGERDVPRPLHSMLPDFYS